jgi:hypothetical protein
MQFSPYHSTHGEKNQLLVVFTPPHSQQNLCSALGQIKAIFAPHLY